MICEIYYLPRNVENFAYLRNSIKFVFGEVDVAKCGPFKKNLPINEIKASHYWYKCFTVNFNAGRAFL